VKYSLRAASLLTGGSYAVSAALVIYIIESGALEDASLRLPLLAIWAVVGIGLAFLGLFGRGD